MSKNKQHSVAETALERTNEKAAHAETVRNERNERKKAAKEKLEKTIANLLSEKDVPTEKTSRTKKEYRKFLNRQRNAKKKLAVATSKLKKLTEEKHYSVMVSYEEKLYPQISEVVKKAISEKTIPKTDILTKQYFAIDCIDSATLEKIRSLMSTKDCKLTLKKSTGDVTLKPRISAVKSLKWEKEQKKLQDKKPTNNTPEKKVAAKQKRKQANIAKHKMKRIIALRRNLRKKGLEDIIEAMDKKTIKISDAEAWAKSPTVFKINAVGKCAKRKIGQHSAGAHANKRKTLISAVKIVNMKQLKQIQSKEMKGAA